MSCVFQHFTLFLKDRNRSQISVTNGPRTDHSCFAHRRPREFRTMIMFQLWVCFERSNQKEIVLSGQVNFGNTCNNFPLISVFFPSFHLVKMQNMLPSFEKCLWFECKAPNDGTRKVYQNKRLEIKTHQSRQYLLPSLSFYTNARGFFATSPIVILVILCSNKLDLLLSQTL